MLEQIGEVNRERLEYKEYIEQWIHCLLYTSFVRIILKLQCYYHLEIYSGKWMEYMEIHELAASEEMFFWQVRN